MRLFQNAKYNFLGGRRTAVFVSGTVLLLALAAAIFWQVDRGSWVNYGVDFTGGTMVQLRFEEQTSVAELREIVQPEFPGTEITRFGGENEFLVRAPAFSGEGQGTSEQIEDLFEANIGADAFELVRTEAVGPKIGNELQQKAALAILFSFILTLIYLAIRFEWRFGVAAIIATLHDILITLGVISAFQLEVSLPTVAAVLTIIGYSLNDTIVVFDRVRENLKKLGRKETYESILNRSINETLPRTVMTSGTTLAALAALLILGGAIIRDFAIILIVGMSVGTYSSIFTASPALLEIQKRWGKRSKKGGRRRRSTRKAGASV